MYTAGRVVETILADDLIRGVTSVDDELFVLLDRNDNQVAVYNINDYKLLRHLHLPELEGDFFNYMTSCRRHRCLYVSHNSSKCTHRFDLSSSAVTKWSVPYRPYGLSVTPSCNLLVTCGRQTNKLLELSADSGQCVREITLQADIKDLWHAVQLTTGQFVVCHGEGDRNLHRVCLVDDEGKVTRSYDGQSGSDVGELNWPSHFAVDDDSLFIFVADFYNNRVVLLSPTLEFVRDYREGLSYPRRLYLHQATRRLFVSPNVHRSIDIIQL